MLMQRLSLGFSPCPNDTHIFYALTHGHVRLAGLEFDREILADVETLNAWAMEGRLDVTKLSFHALGHVLDRYVLLGSGAALGRGCGPLLVAAEPMTPDELAAGTVAIPGIYTTAAMLLRLFAPQCRHIVTMPFDEIMAAVKAGQVDAGVIIHESRFTYRRHSLVVIRDLGDWWEETSGFAIPLGGIAARRSLGRETIMRIEAVIRASVAWADRYPDRCMGYIKQHAREMEEQVLSDHVGLYVNQYTHDLGRDGTEAVAVFLERGRQAGILPAMAATIPVSASEMTD